MASSMPVSPVSTRLRRVRVSMSTMSRRFIMPGSAAGSMLAAISPPSGAMS
jgi:hypothetical protein